MTIEIEPQLFIETADKTVGTAPPINRQRQSLNVVNGVVDANTLWDDGTVGDLELRPRIDVDWSNPQAGREKTWAIED